jgi:hypothetical protein
LCPFSIALVIPKNLSSPRPCATFLNIPVFLQCRVVSPLPDP